MRCVQLQFNSEKIETHMTDKPDEEIPDIDPVERINARYLLGRRIPYNYHARNGSSEVQLRAPRKLKSSEHNLGKNPKHAPPIN